MTGVAVFVVCSRWSARGRNYSPAVARWIMTVPTVGSGDMHDEKQIARAEPA